MVAPLRQVRGWRDRLFLVEPFQHESAVSRFTKYSLAVLCYLLAWAPILSWLLEPEVSNPQKCSTRTAAIILACVFAANVVLEQILALKSKSKFRQVVLGSPPPRPSPHGGPDEHPLIAYDGSLADTVDNIRALIEEERSTPGDASQFAAFLRSQQGLDFLDDVRHGVRRFRTLNGKLVRMSRFKHIVFFMASNLCCMVSVLAALQESQTCGKREISLNFLEKLGITLLTLMAITTFSGIQDYAMLFVTKEHIPLTDDEKLLISLISANIDFQDAGLPADIFIPLPPGFAVPRTERATMEGPGDAKNLEGGRAETEELVPGLDRV